MTVIKQLATMEDLAQGVGPVQQTRNGQGYNLGKVATPYTVETGAELSAVDVTKFSLARILVSNVYTNYRYDANDTSGVPSAGLGTWIRMTEIDGTPLEDGLWGVGKEYTDSAQYLVFDGVPYKPFNVPYTVQGADPTQSPDLENVQAVVSTDPDPLNGKLLVDISPNHSDNGSALSAISATTRIPQGAYTLLTPWICNADNAIIFGDGIDRTIIESSTLVNLLRFTSARANLVFRDMTFKCTKAQASEDFFGLVSSQDIALTNVIFDNCKFTAPNANTNAAKFIVESSAKLDTVVFLDCLFHDIGRMGLEIQNHNYDTVSRYTKVRAIGCDFKDLGLVGINGMGTSFSGKGSDCKVVHNTFDNCLLVALEVVGANNSMFNHNTFKNLDRECAAISTSGVQLMPDNQFIGNVGEGELNGSLNLFMLDNPIFASNNLSLKGITNTLKLRDTQGLRGTANTIKTQGNYALYVESSTRPATNNSLSHSVLDNSASPSNFATVRFYGAQTVGNRLLDCTIVKGTGGSRADQQASAVGNYAEDTKDSDGTDLNSWLVINIADADYDLASTEAGVLFPKAIRFVGSPTAVRTITMPAINRGIHIWNSTAFDLSITVPSGVSPQTLAVEEKRPVFYDGVNAKLF